MLVDTGSLSLNGGEIRIQYEVRESCIGSVISSHAGAAGPFEQNGTTLNLRANLGGGLYETYQASIKLTTIEVPAPLHNYVFRRWALLDGRALSITRMKPACYDPRPTLPQGDCCDDPCFEPSLVEQCKLRFTRLREEARVDRT